MKTAADLSRDDWDRLLQAPFCAYRLVTAGGATEADARVMRDEVAHAPAVFEADGVGHTLAVALVDNLDILWAAHDAGGLDPGKGIERAMRVLKNCSPEEQVAVRRWLLALGVRVARSSRVAGEPDLSTVEVEGIRELAGLLRMPVPDLEPEPPPG